MSNSLEELKKKLVELKEKVPSLPHLSPYDSPAAPSCFGPDECFYGCDIFTCWDIKTHVLSNKAPEDIVRRLLVSFREERNSINLVISKLERYVEEADK